MKTLSDRITLAVIAALVLGTLAVFPALPAQVPIHMDLHGDVDGFAPRALGAAILPLSTLFVFAVTRLGGGDRPGARRAAVLTVLFLGALQVLILKMALAGSTSAGTALAAVLGAFDLALGLVLPRVRRNRWIGIRLPWTLASDENWARTHVFAGRLFVASGLSSLAACLVAPSVATPIAIVTVLLATAAASVYSHRLSRTP